MYVCVFKVGTHWHAQLGYSDQRKMSAYKNINNTHTGSLTLFDIDACIIYNLLILRQLMIILTA